MKKLLLLVAVFVVLTFAFAACRSDNNNNDTGTTPGPEGAVTPAGEVAPAPEGFAGLGPHNPIEIHMLITTNDPAPAPDNRIVDLIREELGVTLSWEVLSPEMQAERISLLLAGGATALEGIDIFATSEQEARLTEAGALLRLDPFIDSGRFPNIAYHVAPYRARLSWRGGGVPDGLYTLPNYNRFYGDPPLMSPIHWGTGFFIQKQVLEFHGFPDVSNMTLERYFQMIEDFIMENPYTEDGLPHIGFTFPAFAGREWGMTNPPLFLAGRPNDGGVFVDFETGEATIYADSEYARRYFEILNQMFLRNSLLPGEAVLIDPEATTQSQDMYNQNLALGRTLGMHDQRWAFSAPHDALVNRGAHHLTHVPLMPTFDGHAPWYADRDVMNIHQGWAVSALIDETRQEHILAFIEEMMTEEWQIIMSWGQVGIDYHVDANGYFYRTPEQRAEQDDIIWRQSNRFMILLDQMPKRQGTLSCGNAFSAGDQPGEFQAGLNDYDRMFLEAYGKTTWREFMNDPPPNPVHYPAWQMNIPGGSPAAIAEGELRDVAAQFLPAVIMAPAGEFAARWEDYLAGIARVNVAAYEEAMTQALQEHMRNLGAFD